MKALRLYAGPTALAFIRNNGFAPHHVSALCGAAGGPKGLMLGPLDRFIFGEWRKDATTPLDLLGASIGAWRFATACTDDAVVAMRAFERAYIHQRYQPPAGKRRPSAQQVSDEFAHSLRSFFDGKIDQVLQHPRMRLHVFTSHGRGLLMRERAWLTPLGYAGAYLSNMVSRRWLGHWLERVVFSSQGHPPIGQDAIPTRLRPLNAENYLSALQASCAIPFVLKAVHDPAHAPPGAYWDGGITDYHLHLNYRAPSAAPLILYPHFQQQLVPGWLDKAWKWRHGATPYLHSVVVVAPNPAWVQTLPNGKLPDRGDFVHYANDFEARVQVWTQAVSAAQQLADEFAEWAHNPDPSILHPL